MSLSKREPLLLGGWGLILLGALGCRGASELPERVPYLAAEATYGFEDFDLSDAEQASGLALDADDSFGFGVRGGVFLRPSVALELQGQLFDGFDVNVPGQSGASADVWAATLNLKVYTDLSATYQVYGLLGLGAMSADLNDPRSFFQELDAVSLAGRAGLGFEGRLASPLYWFVEGGVLEPFGDLDGLRVITLTGGLGWRF